MLAPEGPYKVEAGEPLPVTHYHNVVGADGFAEGIFFSDPEAAEDHAETLNRGWQVGYEAGAGELLATVEMAFVALGRAGGNQVDSPYRDAWLVCRAAIQKAGIAPVQASADDTVKS